LIAFPVLNSANCCKFSKFLPGNIVSYSHD
jgi:hypothetical protein